MKRVCIGVLITLIFLACNAVLWGHLGHSRQPQGDCPFPESGTWRSDQLGITLFLDQDYAIWDDGKEQIRLSYLCDFESAKVYIKCNEQNHSHYPNDYLFFSGDCLDIKEGTFWVKCHKTGNVYRFHRIAETNT